MTIVLRPVNVEGASGGLLFITIVIALLLLALNSVCGGYGDCQLKASLYNPVIYASCLSVNYYSKQQSSTRRTWLALEV